MKKKDVEFRFLIRIEKKVHDLVMQVAKEEQRSINQMYSILCVEAIMARLNKRKKN